MKSPIESALKWYSDVISVFDSLNIAWAKWDYKGGFGVYTSQNQQKKDLLKVLMSGSGKKVVVGETPVYLDTENLWNFV